MNGKDKIKLENLRKIRALAIIAKGDTPEVIENNVWVVPSQHTPNKTYTVYKIDKNFACNCPDFVKNTEKGEYLRCKHIQMIEIYQRLQHHVDDDVLTLKAEINHPQCPNCSSYEVVKKGFRQTKSGQRQKYRCNHCNYWFVLEPIKYRKGNTKLIALCLDLYFKGLSLRKIANTIEQFYDLKLHHDTIRVWINTFMSKITDYVRKYKPKLGEIWNIDEQMVKSNGDWVYSWNALDEKTRYLIANTVTKGRSIFETKKIMKEVKRNVETEPHIVITDKMRAYPQALNDEFDGVFHVKSGLRDTISNNKLERYHGTFRERDKVMRGLKTDITAEEMLQNYRTYYNFIRPHQALEGKTPSEMAGIDINLGKNKWVGLIEQSINSEVD